MCFVFGTCVVTKKYCKVLNDMVVHNGGGGNNNNNYDVYIIVPLGNMNNTHIAIVLL